MSGNELLGIAFPFVLAALLLALAFTGSWLSESQRMTVERFVLLPLLVLAEIGLGVYAVIERRWTDGVWLLPGALSIIWTWRRSSHSRRENPGA